MKEDIIYFEKEKFQILFWGSFLIVISSASRSLLNTNFYYKNKKKANYEKSAHPIIIGFKREFDLV